MPSASFLEIWDDAACFTLAVKKGIEFNDLLSTTNSAAKSAVPCNDFVGYMPNEFGAMEDIISLHGLGRVQSCSHLLQS